MPEVIESCNTAVNLGAWIHKALSFAENSHVVYGGFFHFYISLISFLISSKSYLIGIFLSLSTSKNFQIDMSANSAAFSIETLPSIYIFIASCIIYCFNPKNNNSLNIVDLPSNFSFAILSDLSNISFGNVKLILFTFIFSHHI